VSGALFFRERSLKTGQSNELCEKYEAGDFEGSGSRVALSTRYETPNENNRRVHGARREDIFTESLILAQDERLRRA
jgi:hypothetical protein